MVAELEQDTQKTNILGQNVPEKFDWQKKQREMYEEKKQKQEQEDIITGKMLKRQFLITYLLPIHQTPTNQESILILLLTLLPHQTYLKL